MQTKKPNLVSPDQAPKVESLSVPLQLYWLLPSPVPLVGMQLPSPRVPWSKLHSLGFRWIVCLCSDRPIYDPSPLERLVTVELTDLAEIELPDDPDMEEQGIQIIASKVREKLLLGEGVIIHCAGGRGRTGTVLGVTLKKLGYPYEDVMQVLNQIQVERGKPRWWESPWQRRLVEKAEADVEAEEK